MSAARALRLPLEADLSGFVGLLERLQVPHRVSLEGEEQVLWVAETDVPAVQAWYQRFPDGNAGIDLAAPERPAPDRLPGLGEQLRGAWMCATVLLASILVAVVTGLGDNLAALGWLTFLEFRVQGDYLYFTPLAQELAEGQWWRLFSPMLVHFGVLHLAMNGLWYWELGRRIERRHGPWVLLGFTLLFGLVSNLAQHLASGPGLFGGLSGVLYGLLGYVWLYHRLAPDAAFSLPRGTLASMLVWLLVCLSGVVGLLGFGAIANAAHVSGLLVGCLSGLLGGALARRKLSH
ncbi:rhomboid family intramembrane serine protease [Pseudomonas sp. Marseille-QA0332]